MLFRSPEPSALFSPWGRPSPAREAAGSAFSARTAPGRDRKAPAARAKVVRVRDSFFIVVLPFGSGPAFCGLTSNTLIIKPPREMPCDPSHTGVVIVPERAGQLTH